MKKLRHGHPTYKQHFQEQPKHTYFIVCSVLDINHRNRSCNLLTWSFTEDS